MPHMSPMYCFLLMFYFIFIVVLPFFFLSKPTTMMNDCSKFHFNWSWKQIYFHHLILQLD